jgi:cell division septum initiation protein DivIVA
MKAEIQQLAEEKERDLLFEAKNEANELLLTAKAEADKILHSAKIENGTLKSNMLQMSIRATKLHTQLKELLTEQLALLENEQWEKVPQELTAGLADVSEKYDKRLIKLSEASVSSSTHLNFDTTLDEASALLKKLN